MSLQEAHTDAPSPTAGGLAARIGLGQAVALYVSAILGAGVLTLPGQAASLAGPASLLAWLFSSLLGMPLAVTFAALATRMPGAGGVATFASTAFGERAGGVVGWWYFIAGSVGQTIVPLTGGYYLAQALGAGQEWSYAIAGVILAVAVVANLAGVKVSGPMQVALALGVALVLIVAVISSLSDLHPHRLHPFAPHGVAAIGQAVIVLFFAFAGWEAIAHLSGEFRHPGDIRRATLVTIAVVSTLYLAVAAAVVLTGTYGDPRTDGLAIGLLLQHTLGIGASTAAGVAALVISLGTTNAFVASVSRLGYALSEQHWMPGRMGHVNAHDVPSASIVMVGAVGGGGLVLAWLYGWSTQSIVAIPATLVVATYLVGMGAGVRLLAGRARGAAIAALLLTACTLPFAFGHVLLPIGVAATALAYQRVAARRARRSISRAECSL